MTASRKLLFVGESWIKHTTHMKGFDHFVSVEYEEGASVFLACLATAGIDVTYIRAHEVSARFPTTLEALQAFDAVGISDVGSNSFLLTDETFLRSAVGVNRLQLIADYVAQGGGLLKIGGYMSFTGIDARARYGMTPLAAVLPVDLLPHDDRIEKPEGVIPTLRAPAHPAIGGVTTPWPALLGYNRTIARPGATIIAAVDDDPLLVAATHGAGRVIAFTSDIAPHWAPPAFLQWQDYGRLFAAIVTWVCTGQTN